MNQRERYNRIWDCGDVQKPEIWSVWEIVKDFKGERNLEIGPGNYPKIPIEGGYFLDISERAVKNLREVGGQASVGDIINLPFKNNFFDLVVAIEVLEHIDDDRKALFEIARVLRPRGFFLFSVPLRRELFSEIDVIAGHKRRYEVKELRDLLSYEGFEILKYRPPSFYLKTLDKWAGRVQLKNVLYKSKSSLDLFHLPRPFVNLCSRAMAFLDRKGVPPWQEAPGQFLEYQERGVVILCQK